MGIDLKKILIPLVIALITASVLLIIRGIAFRLFHRWTEKTETKIDDIITGSLKTPSIWWCLATGLYIGVDISELPKRYAFYFSKAIYVVIILSNRSSTIC